MPATPISAADMPDENFSVCPIWRAIIQHVGYKPHPWDNAREGTLTGVDDAVRAIRAIFAGQIQWTPGEPPKQDGIVVYGHTWQPYRWKAYSPKSEQHRRGIKGRWQAMNEYGGWDNAKAPDEWAPESIVQARMSLSPDFSEVED